VGNFLSITRVLKASRLQKLYGKCPLELVCKKRCVISSGKAVRDNIGDCSLIVHDYNYWPRVSKL
jgi:hypothetical protein